MSEALRVLSLCGTAYGIVSAIIGISFVGYVIANGDKIPPWRLTRMMIIVMLLWPLFLAWTIIDQERKQP
jgi:hypothetical protein